MSVPLIQFSEDQAEAFDRVLNGDGARTPTSKARVHAQTAHVHAHALLHMMCVLDVYARESLLRSRLPS